MRSRDTRITLAITAILCLALVAGPVGCTDATGTEAPAAQTGEADQGDSHDVTGRAGRSVAILWNEAMLAAVRHGPPRPTVIARSMYLVHAAMYDAWSVYDPVAIPTTLDASFRQPFEAHTISNKQAAVSQAAYSVLMELFPEYEEDSHAFGNLLHSLGYEVVTEAAATTPGGIGLLAAESVLENRHDDGSNADDGYADMTSDTYPELYAPVNSADPEADTAPGHDGFDPNRWEPLRVPSGTLLDRYGIPLVDASDPDTYGDQVFLTPHWGAIRPFALTSGDQFRPVAPPQYGSDEPYVDALGNTMTNDEAWHMQVDQVLRVSAGLTDEEKCMAEYWADGPRSETPPGHWNALAHGVCYRDSLGLDDDVKLFFALDGALLDASIAAWEAKRYYDYVRPASAIRHKYAGQMVEAWAGPGQGSRLIPGEEWLPYQDLTFVTPAFPEYVSGHSTFSAAAAEVLTLFTGSNRYYDGSTMLYHEDFNNDGVPDMLGQYVVPVGGNAFEKSPSEVVVLRWKTFQDAADEAGVSRIYGGIHFQDGDLRGRDMGTAIGGQAYELAEAYWTGTVAR